MGTYKTHAVYTPAGSFNNRVTLLKPNTTKTATGGAQPPATVATVWAAVNLMAPRDIEKQQQVVGEVTHKVIIRFRSGITSDMLVQLGNRILNVKSLKDPDERGVELWLFCFERGDGVAT